MWEQTEAAADRAGPCTRQPGEGAWVSLQPRGITRRMGDGMVIPPSTLGHVFFPGELISKHFVQVVGSVIHWDEKSCPTVRWSTKHPAMATVPRAHNQVPPGDHLNNACFLDWTQMKDLFLCIIHHPEFGIF